MKCEIIDLDLFLQVWVERQLAPVKKHLKTIAFVRMKEPYVIEKDTASIEVPQLTGMKP